MSRRSSARRAAPARRRTPRSGCPARPAAGPRSRRRPRRAPARQRHEDASAVLRVGAAAHEPARGEPVHPVRHRAARHQGLLQQRLRAELVRFPCTAQRRQDVELPRLDVARVERRRRARSRCRASRSPRDSTSSGRSPGRGAPHPRRDDRSTSSCCGIPPSWPNRRRAASVRVVGRMVDAPGRVCSALVYGSTTAFGAVRSGFESWRRSEGCSEFSAISVGYSSVTLGRGGKPRSAPLPGSLVLSRRPLGSVPRRVPWSAFASRNDEYPLPDVARGSSGL